MGAHTCPKHAHPGIPPSHLDHLSKHLLKAAQQIHMGAHVPKPLKASPPTTQPSGPPPANAAYGLRATQSHRRRGLPMSTAALPKTPPYQLISSRGKSKQKQFASSVSSTGSN